MTAVTSAGGSKHSHPLTLRLRGVVVRTTPPTQIGCAACVDGCDQVMDKMGSPRGLIRYTTEHAMESHLDRAGIWKRVLRLRTLVYGAVLVLIAGTAAYSLATRNPLRADIIRDRGALAREVGAGNIENVYRVQIMNTDEKPRRFTIAAQGLPGLAVMGIDQPVEVGAAATSLLPLRLQVPLQAGPDGPVLAPGPHRIEFVIQSVDEPQVNRHEPSSFIVPR